MDGVGWVPLESLANWYSQDGGEGLQTFMVVLSGVTLGWHFL